MLYSKKVAFRQEVKRILKIEMIFPLQDFKNKYTAFVSIYFLFIVTISTQTKQIILPTNFVIFVKIYAHSSSSFLFTKY